MSRFLLFPLLILGFTLNLNAQEPVLTAPAPVADLEEWLQSRSDLKLSDLTIGDLVALAKAQDLARQQAHYVGSATVSSFLLPGLGQFKVGDPLGGTLHLLGQAALVGATVYGVVTLLPAELKASGLSHDQRRDLVHNLWLNDPGRIAPVAGVMLGGLSLSLIHSLWASADAKSQALENLEAGTVTFEPALFGFGPGFRMRM